MGGNAFKVILPHASFPRMSPATYDALKTHIISRLSRSYAHVAVPYEVPEKVDHGDLDVVVCGPLHDVTPDSICDAIGATHSIILRGNRMSNYALPAHPGEQVEDSTDEIYHQVDIQVCDSHEEWHRVVFFHSYGDLGAILGLLAKACQLVLGSSGLRLGEAAPTSPPCTFYLSQSFPDILLFFGLTMERWTRGFSSQHEIFDWVMSSPFFGAWNSTRDVLDVPRRMGNRPMYRNFVHYARVRRGMKDNRAGPTFRIPDMTTVLSYFGKLDLHHAILQATKAKRYARSVLNGRTIEQWANVKGPSIAVILGAAKQKLGGEGTINMFCGVSTDAAESNNLDPLHLTVATWENSLMGMSEENVRKLVVQVAEDLAGQGKLRLTWDQVNKAKKASKQSGA